jgi:hypothetical protein
VISLTPALKSIGEVRIKIPYAPRAVFKPFHSRKQRFANIVAHRRCGKTVATINDDIRKILTNTRTFPVPQILFVSPTFGQSKRNVWTYAKHFTAGIPGIKAGEAELTLTFPNGGKYIFAGSDNYDSLRGMYLDHCTLDEYGTMNPMVWSEVVRPALSDYKGTATFIGSAAGRNHFYDLRKQHKDDPDWYMADFKASETGILEPDELLLAKSTMLPEAYQQEYENSFDAAVRGSYYGADIEQAERENRIRPVWHDKFADVYAGWDLGIGDSTGVWVFQIVGSEFHFLHYYENSGKGLDHYVDYLKLLPYKIVEHILPHDAEARELQTGKSRYEFLTERKFNCTVLPPHNPEDGINEVRMHFNKFYFDKEHTDHGVDCLRMYAKQWDEKKKVFSLKPMHNWASHCADALRYAIMGARSKMMSDWSKPIIRNLHLVR